MLPGVKISAGMIPTFALPGRERARAVRPDHPDALRADVRVDAQHVVGGDALGDRDHGVDAGVDRLVDRRRRRTALGRRPSTCSRRARAPRRRRCRRRARPRRPGRPCPASRRRRGSSRRRGCGARGTGPSDPVRPWTTSRVSVSTMIAIRPPFAARIAILSSVSRPPATRSPRSSSTRAASSPSQPVRASHAAKSIVCAKSRTSSTPSPAPSTKLAPLGLACSCARATGRGASPPPRPSSPMKTVSTSSTRSPRDARHLAERRAATSAKWCAAVRHATTSKLAVGERQRLGAADDVRMHSGRRIAT